MPANPRSFSGMTLSNAQPVLRQLAAAALFLLLSACAETLVYETRSDYSQIEVRDSGTKRALYFVGDTDSKLVETVIDRRAPHVLQHGYTRAAMVALLYRPGPSSCLLVGLGGGAIVRFLNHHFPDMRLDVVEIDPVVVRVAREYFELREVAGTRIHVADGRKFLESSAGGYDVILIDVHLHPDLQTDSTGTPLSLKSLAFYERVRSALSPGGIAMFNVIVGPDAGAYIGGIRAAFRAVDIYWPVDTLNLVVFASGDGALPDEAQLRETARALDRNGRFGFSFVELLDLRSRR